MHIKPWGMNRFYQAISLLMSNMAGMSQVGCEFHGRSPVFLFQSGSIHVGIPSSKTWVNLKKVDICGNIPPKFWKWWLEPAGWLGLPLFGGFQISTAPFGLALLPHHSGCAELVTTRHPDTGFVAEPWGIAIELWTCCPDIITTGCSKVWHPRNGFICHIHQFSIKEPITVNQRDFLVVAMIPGSLTMFPRGIVDLATI